MPKMSSPSQKSTSNRQEGGTSEPFVPFALEHDEPPEGDPTGAYLSQSRGARSTGAVTTADGTVRSSSGTGDRASTELGRVLATRGISLATAARCGVALGEKPASGTRPLTFRYFNAHKVALGTKFVLLKEQTGQDKRVWQEGNCSGALWGIETHDPAWRGPVVITEGELDRMAVLEADPNIKVYSVPNGAPLKRIEDDDAPKLAYLNDAYEPLANASRIYLATDADPQGQILFEELARRLGRGRCWRVEYPEGCKDFDAVLMDYGPDEVIRTLQNASPAPLSGIVSFSDLGREQMPDFLDVGIPALNHRISLWEGAFMVLTGVPGHGKSVLANQIAIHLWRKHKWPALIFSPEMIAPVLRKEFVQKFLMHTELSEFAVGAAEKSLEEGIHFLRQDDADESRMNIDWILDRASESVARYGTKTLLIDPWNEVDHGWSRHETETQYISRVVRSIKRFGRANGVATIVVAHPTKLSHDRDGNVEVPTLYSISGSANWYNKADIGVIVYRGADKSFARVEKVKYQPLAGTTNGGDIPLKFHPELLAFKG